MSSLYNRIKLCKYPKLLYNTEFFVKIKTSLFLDFSTSVDSSRAFKLHLLYSSQCHNKTKIRRGCITTGQSRSVCNTFSFSRFSLKHRAVQGLVTGLKKASW